MPIRTNGLRKWIQFGRMTGKGVFGRKEPAVFMLPEEKC